MRLELPSFLRQIDGRRMRVGGIVAGICVIVAAVWFFFPHIHRTPPNIFDTPVDGVLDYLAADDFNQLTIQERTEYLAGIFGRFNGMGQGDSVIASAFFAGLTGPANEKLVNNARILGKDIFVQGAKEYFDLKTQQERDAFVDRWVVTWVRFAEQATGQSSNRSDEEILRRMTTQATREARQIGDMNVEIAQQIVDLWDRDVASVASPREQAQIFQFGPAIRQRLLTRGQ